MLTGRKIPPAAALLQAAVPLPEAINSRRIAYSAEETATVPDAAVMVIPTVMH